MCEWQNYVIYFDLCCKCCSQIIYYRKVTNTHSKWAFVSECMHVSALDVGIKKSSFPSEKPKWIFHVCVCWGEKLQLFMGGVVVENLLNFSQLSLLCFACFLACWRKSSIENCNCSSSDDSRKAFTRGEYELRMARKLFDSNNENTT